MAKDAKRGARGKTERRPKELKQVSTVPPEAPPRPAPVARAIKDPPKEKKAPVPETPGSVKTVVMGSDGTPVPAPGAAPAPAAASAATWNPLGALPSRVVGKKGDPYGVGEEKYILRYQTDLDIGSIECWLHDEESIKSVTDSSLPEEERYKNVRLRGKRASMT